MSFGSHQNYAQQWAADSSAAPSPDNAQRPYPPHPQNFPPPPPLYPTPGGYYPIPPGFPNANGILPPRPPLPFPNAMPPYPPYGAPPVPPLGFPPFPPIPHRQQGSEIVSGTSTPRAVFNAAPDTSQEQVPHEPPETLDSDEREEGELSSGEMEEDQNGTTSEPKLKNYRQSEVVPSDGDLNQEQRDNSTQATSAGHGKVSSSNAASLAPQYSEPASNGYTPLSESNGNDVEMSDVGAVESGPSNMDGNSPPQLRTLAQGALLNLAPHNIRFKELVEEGIDPVILKSLYDELGIKVPLAGNDDKKMSTQFESMQEVMPTSPSVPITKETAPVSLSESKPTRERQQFIANSQQNTSTKGQSVGLGSTPLSTAPGKPLERKELIARMLAAKAGKPASSDTVPTISVMQPKEDTGPAPIPPNQNEVTEMDTTMDGQLTQETTLATSTEARVKEINQAQTELARQRMEQLKKQGLKRSQTHPGSVSLSTSHEYENGVTGEVSQQSASQAASLRHPLPERPPEPDAVAVPPTRIPGLFMTEPDSATADQPPEAVANFVQQHLSAAKTPRKRPRASDFNDNVIEETSSKKPTLPGTLFPKTSHRVVIDISEDESMYGSDNDTVSETRAISKGAVPANRVATGPLRDSAQTSRIPSTNAHSQLTTPTGSSLAQTPRDQQHLESEIQNLRQQIAEMERRRKEKLAATQSQLPGPTSIPSDMELASPLPKFPSDISPDRFEQRIPSTKDLDKGPKIAVDGMETSTLDTLESAPTRVTAVASTASPLRRSRSSLGPGEIEEMRKKLLRKQEIESGLPVLEAELQKSAERLTHLREEQRKLLEEIEKGKAGRLKLVEELKSLGIETDGLTMDELQAAKDSLESGTALESDHSAIPDGTPEQTGPMQSAESTQAQLPVVSVQDPTVASGAQSVESAASLEGMADESVPMNLDDDRASRSSSAMDESMGSDSDVEQLQESEEEPMDLVDESTTSTPPPIDSVGSNPSEVLEITQVHQFDKEKSVSRERSVSSDVYEPPEPEESAVSEKAYSPPISLEPMAMEPPQTSTSAEAVDEPAPNERDQEAENENKAQSSRHFVPYQSPLSNFRAYRYHPQYTDNIKGGFRSLTYSNNINPNSPLCAFEIYGGVCNDRDCQFQHLRDLSLSDDRILVEMGSLREGKTQKEQDEYVAGLRQIINDMRRDKVKDFTKVATEIAAYRRRFLQDPSRVLAL